MNTMTSNLEVNCRYSSSYEGHVVHVDGKSLAVAGQGWSIVTLRDNSTGDYLMCVNKYPGTRFANQHRLAVNCTDGARLLAHWSGYVANTKKLYNLL